MVAAAVERLGADRMTYLTQDLLDPIPIDPVDAILSTATFHWIVDHDRLFANLAAVLRPRGQLVAQCGGWGNLERVNGAAERAAGIDLMATKRYRDPGGDVDPARGRRLRRHRDLADRSAHRAARRRARAVSANRDPQRRGRAPIAGGRRPAGARGRDGARRALDRLRPAEHRREDGLNGRSAQMNSGIAASRISRIAVAAPIGSSSPSSRSSRLSPSRSIVIWHGISFTPSSCASVISSSGLATF